MKKFIGKKVFYKEVLIVSTPIIIQNMLTNLVSLIDNLMVGQLGEDVVASVGVINQMFLITTLSLFGITAGIGIFTSQFYGANNEVKIKETYRLKLVSAIIFSLFSIGIILLFKDIILGAFLSDSRTIELAESYLSIVLITILLNGLGLSMGSTFREIGYTKYPLYSAIFAIAINTFLNYCLIFGNYGFPELGIKGAAYATLIARSFELLFLYIIKLKIKPCFKDKFRNIFKIPKSLLVESYKKVSPILLNEVMYSSALFVFLWSFSTRGENVVAAFQVTETIKTIIFAVYGGLSVSVGIMIGKRLGANKIKEAEENAPRLIFLAMITSISISAILFPLAPVIVNLYNFNTETIMIAIYATWIMLLLTPMFAINNSYFYIFRSGGDTKSMLITDALVIWSIKVPLSIVLSLNTDLNALILLVIILSMDLISVTVGTFFYKKKRWLKNLTEI